MVKYLYTAVFFLSFILLVVLTRYFKKHISGYYVLLFSAILVVNYGYMLLARSNVPSTALAANGTIYLGSAFAPYLLTMCMADLCRVRVNKLFRFLLILMAFVIFEMSGTVGISTLYYKSVTFSYCNGIGMLTKEYGPLYILYPVYLMINTAFCLWMIIRSFLKKKNVSYYTSALLSICMMVTLGAYIVQKITSFGLDIIPMSYVVSEVGVLILLQRITMYDVEAITTNYMMESFSEGFVICDMKGKLLGSDEAAKTWFPELSRIQIDKVIQERNTELLWHIGQWLDGATEQEIIYTNAGDKVIAVRHAILEEKRKSKIHCFYMRDDTKQQQYTKLVEEYNENLSRDVDDKVRQLHQMQDDIIIGMASIVENRDTNTGGHVARTSDVVRIFVKHLQREQIYDFLTPEMANAIIKAAPLHDFGKIGIPDSILNKPGKFEPWEYEEMKKHAQKGAEVVERILQNTQDEQFKQIAVNIAHYHHEKWDGSGYPTGIKKEQIPFEARVMALADVFDALVSKRVYKEKYDYDRAFAIIAESKGSHFDPVLCREFLKCRAQLERMYDYFVDDEAV